MGFAGRGARRTLAAAGLLCMALAAVPSAPSAATHTSAQNQQAAQRDAAGLLGRVVLPSGALASGTEPPGDGGALSQAPSRPAVANLIDQASWWTVSESWHRVIDFIDSHPPAGGVLQVMGMSGGGGQSPQSAWAGFAFPAVPHVLGQRQLEVLVAPLSGGGTGIRADAQVQWLIPRPTAERVPASARVLRVSRGLPGHPPAVSVLVTKRKLVAHIADLIDALDIVQPGAWSCPGQPPSGPVVTFAFRARRGGAVLARASEAADARPPATPCQAMSFSVRGRSQPALLDGGSVIAQTQSLLGVPLAR